MIIILFVCFLVDLQRAEPLWQGYEPTDPVGSVSIVTIRL